MLCALSALKSALRPYLFGLQAGQQCVEQEGKEDSDLEITSLSRQAGYNNGLHKPVDDCVDLQLVASREAGKSRVAIHAHAIHAHVLDVMHVQGT